MVAAAPGDRVDRLTEPDEVDVGVLGAVDELLEPVVEAVLGFPADDVLEVRERVGVMVGRGVVALLVVARIRAGRDAVLVERPPALPGVDGDAGRTSR